MSGYKRATVTINQEEYDRLREAGRQLRAIPEMQSITSQAISQQSIEALRTNLEEFHNRQSVFENMVAGMNDHIREQERTTAQAIEAYEANAMAATQALAGELWDHVDQVIADRTRYFNEQIAAARHEYQVQMEQYSWQVRRIERNEQRKQELAYDWLNAASQFSDFIQQQYAHDWFTPGRVAELNRKLNQASNNLEDGLTEAVILTTQQLYNSFSDLRIELERLQAEWKMLMQTAWETVSQILALAKESSYVQAVDLDGNLLPYDIQVGYWSHNNRLAELIAELTNIKDWLESGSTPPKIEELEHMLQMDLPAYYQALEDIVQDARVTAINSQLRINIADMVVRALQEQGFALERSDYEADDMRSSYGARLVNLEGNEVLVEVAPAGEALGENELHLQSLDRAKRTEHELQQRWYEVSRSLSNYGVSVGHVVREDAANYQTGPANKPRHESKRQVRNQQGNRDRPVQGNGN